MEASGKDSFVGRFANRPKPHYRGLEEVRDCLSSSIRDLSMSRQPTLFLIDPDGPTREAITKLAGLMNLPCEAFETGQDFFAAFDPERPGCVVMEIKVPGMNGLQIQQRLGDFESNPPVIFINARPSVSIAVHAMRCGAACVGKTGPRE